MSDTNYTHKPQPLPSPAEQVMDHLLKACCLIEQMSLELGRMDVSAAYTDSERIFHMVCNLMIVTAKAAKRGAQ
jgi:hypothetical protein